MLFLWGFYKWPLIPLRCFERDADFKAVLDTLSQQVSKTLEYSFNLYFKPYFFQINEIFIGLISYNVNFTIFIHINLFIATNHQNIVHLGIGVF